MNRVVLALLAALLFASTASAVHASPTLPAQVEQSEEPAIAPDSAQAGAIVEFRATPARARGRINVSWRYTGKGFNGSFVVERSTNGGAWRTIGACTQAVTGKGAYGCSETGLSSGTAYAYRACMVSRGAACAGGATTKATVVKAP